MTLFKDSKSYLEYIGKDSTLLSLTIVILFIENVSLITFNESLINDKKINFEQILNFKFLFGFVIFIFACKPLFIIFYHWINYFPIFKYGYETSYKVGFGCFVLAILLFYHAYSTNESNYFVQYSSKFSYKTIASCLGFLSLFFASICNWEGKEHISKKTH